MNGKGTWLILGCCGPHHDGSGHTNVWTSACEEANPCDHGKARSDHPSGKRRSGHRVSVAYHKTENAGLAALEDALNNGLSAPFVEAVKLIVASRGRLVVTGVGKSGHIGSKLAATFASTGTSAFFVHSAEANHGDLGMIGRDDVILAISWSGETAELKGIVNYSQRFRIPLIAITAGENSALGRAADVVLLLPKTAEACPHGLAPTTSTMMQLAIGDALAIALLEARGFTPSDFKTFHPGGSWVQV